jgi:anti-sigma regulatory factor (Ser/Thr protein kinase)
MEMIHVCLEIGDASGVGHARRQVADMARDLGFGDVDVGRATLIVTEAASNLVKHADGGEILLRAARQPMGNEIDVLALDTGPGIDDIGAALRDGFSSAGTSGTGLGAIARVASVFDCYSRPKAGTAVFARVALTGGSANGWMIDGINVPYPGELVSGDTWAVSRRDGKASVLLADGLGHGPSAHEAARVAAAAFRAHAADPPAQVAQHIHAALRPTRGAAIAVAQVDRSDNLIRFAGLGNIAGTIVNDGATRSVVSHHGTAGHDARRIQEFTYPWATGARLVLHTDGLATRWTLDAYPGLLTKHAVLVAAVLYRDFRRGRDDTTVVVVREAA